LTNRGGLLSNSSLFCIAAFKSRRMGSLFCRLRSPGVFGLEILMTR
jgi:hypothetical protein